MDKKHKIGRNAPCPCGSGKKYKKCCGAVSQTGIVMEKETDYFKLNREIAYKGKIGRMREEFCVRYIKHKQQAFKEIRKTQLEIATSKGENITCQKGCSFCCVQYVDANIQEGEAIVYYLYQNESVLNNFLQVYSTWREKVRDSGDSFKKMIHHWQKAEDTKWKDEETLQAGLNEVGHYATANIPCPFLHDSLCSIYEVRPYTCASLFATTPAEWCNPSNPNKARIYQAIKFDEFNDTSFYYQNLKQPVQSFMPVMVYQKLSYGLIGMPNIPGLENLPDEFMNDPEVRPIIQRYLKTR